MDVWSYEADRIAVYLLPLYYVLRTPKAESRNDVFSGQYVYFEKTPEVVVTIFPVSLEITRYLATPNFSKMIDDLISLNRHCRSDLINR